MSQTFKIKSNTELFDRLTIIVGSLRNKMRPMNAVVQNDQIVTLDEMRKWNEQIREIMTDFNKDVGRWKVDVFEYVTKQDPINPLPGAE